MYIFKKLKIAQSESCITNPTYPSQGNLLYVFRYLRY